MRRADRILVLQEGKLIEHGSHRDLMAVGGVYAELFTLQAAAYLGDPDQTSESEPVEPGR
ncbi:hypothetical protein ACFY05_01105 [Microtetraspora fusca]|uniref:ABC transporter ATP-binding protein n=1 Tax=Microtetraspora fusca TaxID=1997 RepID=A0ABW6UWK9_MICFU